VTAMTLTGAAYSHINRKPYCFVWESEIIC